MKNIVFAGFLLAMPLAAVAEKFCIQLPYSPFISTLPRELCFEEEKLMEICPYEDCVDRLCCCLQISDHSTLLMGVG
ncbi:hypothetical protein QBC41DRAFT_308529 [Cercophora samala]|uniref:Uncharacterized protein n=1 Tax=Cercophora samala TaxID=330535 RepID=A0AA39YGD2_9PEZI|nr:hypothetical protein QBC41DRAFT_308529 [Cercophora samala]